LSRANLPGESRPGQNRRYALALGPTLDSLAPFKSLALYRVRPEESGNSVVKLLGDEGVEGRYIDKLLQVADTQLRQKLGMGGADRFE
jgi:hypothetical protein